MIAGTQANFGVMNLGFYCKAKSIADGVPHTLSIMINIIIIYMLLINHLLKNATNHVLSIPPSAIVLNVGKDQL